MGIQCDYVSQLTVIETFTDDYVSPSDATVSVSGLNTSETVNGSTDIPVTTFAAFQQALIEGSVTIDLTDLPGLGGASIDGSGLKVQYVKLRGHADNTGPITVAEGGSNGYPLLGAGFTFDLEPGQELTLKLNEAAADISGTDKTIDLTGTNEEVLEVEIVMG